MRIKCKPTPPPLVVRRGHKVKVYNKSGRAVNWGEVIGIGEDGTPLLAQRSDFKDLMAGEFDFLLDESKVRFVTP